MSTERTAAARPQVSVVVPTRDRHGLLRQTLGSVLAQEGVDVELVVVDEASSDDTPAYLAALAAADPRVRVLRHDAPRGVSAARNAGLAAATARLVAFCDDDDLWAPTKLAAQAAAMARTGLRWSCTAAIRFAEGGRLLGAERVRAEETAADVLLVRHTIPGGGSGVLAETSAVREAGGFAGDLAMLADWDMWIRLSLDGPAAVVDAPLVAYRVHSGGMSRVQDRVPAELDILEERWAKERTRRGVSLDRLRVAMWMGEMRQRAGDRGVWRLYLDAAVRHRDPRSVLRAGVGAAWPGSLAIRDRRRRRSVPAGWDRAVSTWLSSGDGGHAAGHRARRTRVVHVGPDRHGDGGIARVIAMIEASAVADEFDLVFVATHRSGARVVAALNGIFHLFLVLAKTRRSRPIVHVHVASRGSFARKVTVIAVARALRCPVVAHIHGGGFAEFVSSSELLRGTARRSLASAAVLVTLSPTWQRAIERELGLRSRVIRNPVRPVGGLRIEPGDGVFFAGRLGSPKGVDVLVEAIRRMQVAGRRTKVTIAGDAPDANEVHRWLGRLPFPEDIALLGWVSADRVLAEMMSAAVFALPSRQEGSPLALLEAMDAGCACVVTPVGGVLDTVRDGLDALVVPVGDDAALSDAIQRLLADPSLRRDLGSSAQRRVRELHGLDSFAAELASLYRALAGEDEPPNRTSVKYPPHGATTVEASAELRSAP